MRPGSKSRPAVIQLPIKTKRLILRDFHVDDWQSVHRYAIDADVIRYVEWGPNTEVDTKNFIARTIEMAQATPRREFELAVILTETNELLGAASVHVSNVANREGWIGYCLNRQSWGQGFATEAATALLTFGFSELGLHRIFATVDPANTASAGVLKKLGMAYEGRFREHKSVRGKWRDTDIYATLESDARFSVG